MFEKCFMFAMAMQRPSSGSFVAKLPVEMVSLNASTQRSEKDTNECKGPEGKALELVHPPTLPTSTSCTLSDMELVPT